MKFSFFSRRRIQARTAILIRTGNRPHFLRRALGSVAAQSDRDWCVVVLNDGEVAAVETAMAPFRERFPGRVHLQNFPRTGSASLGNLNTGLGLSASEFVAIHDDDDSWEPGFLAGSIEALRKEPQAGASVTKAFAVKERVSGEEIQFVEKGIYNEWQGNQISLFRLAESLTFPPIAMLVRRSALESVGPFRADLPLMGDWEFCLRLFAGFPVAYVSEPLANYHLHGGNSTRSEKRDEIYERTGIELRNQLLREDLKAGKVGLGFLVNLSHAHGHLYQEIESLRGKS